jgi:hypothetical protein
MAKQKKSTLDVHGMPIAVLSESDQDFISLTDIARFRNAQDPFAVINNWMRARSTIEFLGLWEHLSDLAFKPLDFERFKTEAGSNYFVLSPPRAAAMSVYIVRAFVRLRSMLETNAQPAVGPGLGG